MKHLTGPQELLATFVACALAVAAVTFVTTDRQPADWIWVPVFAGAVTAGTAVRLWSQSRRRARPAPP